MENRDTARRALRVLVQNGLVAAIYVALGLVLAPIAFGPVQCRVAEALTLLPVINPTLSVGVALGCAITNLVGSATGANFLGVADVFIGTGATLIAALATARLGKIRWRRLPFVASLPPVLINAVVIGAEWSFVTTGSIALTQSWPFMLMIGAGQLLSCSLLGVILVSYLERSGLDKKLFAD